MNYIRHLNAFFSLVRSDKRLTSTNVSLYFALFYYWNFNRFQNPFTIYRENILELSKLSKNTYHKSIKQLHEAKYIYYHKSASRFQEVRISIVRLEKEEEEKKPFKQLNLFAENDEDVGINFKTGTVSNLRPVSTNFETDTVAILRHSINQTNNKLNSVCNTPTEIFEKNKEINEEVNRLAAEENPPLIKGGGRRPGDFKPTLQEVEEFFTQNNYSLTEASKFFHYNQAKNWMLTEKLPIKDWKALAHKWMLNTNIQTQKQNTSTMDEIIQQLYEQYLAGEKINKFILPEFCDHLQLEITDAIRREAIERRINQLSGSNETSVTNLWKAYMQEDYSSELIIADETNLTALTKRIAISKHFQQLKSKQQKIIS